MAKDDRPKMGDADYTEEDGWKDTAALERAVMRGPEAVVRFFERRGGAPFTAGALGIACRYMGIETAQALLSHGASFLPNAQKVPYPAPRDQYELMVLAGPCAVIKRKQKRTISAEERLEMVRALLAAGAADLSEVLYQAILLKEFPIAHELLAAGKELPARRVTLVSGSAGFINPGAGVSEGDRRAFRKALQNADDPELIEMITMLRQCPGIDKVAVYDLDVCSVVKYVANSKEILDRFKPTDMLLFMLENTTMRKVVTRRMLVELFVEKDDARALQWLVDNSFLNRRPEISMLFEVLDETPGTHAELRAIAVAHKAKHQPKKDAMSIPADPFAASILRSIWQYETADDGKTVRILRYKGDDDSVLVPPRIGRRTVTEIAKTVFCPPAPRTPARHYYGYGQYYQPTPPPAQAKCLASVSFPGTIKKLPRCLGYGYGCATASEVVLQNGIEEIEKRAFQGTEIRSITLPESVYSVGDAAFMACASLLEAHLMGGLLRLPADLFAQCSKLRNVTGWSEFRHIGKGAFRQTAIERADLRRAITIKDAVFLDCIRLHEVLLPEQLTEIPSQLFAGCTALEDMPACPRVERIGVRAFAASGLRRVHLGERVCSIGSSAFTDCGVLTSVEICGPVQRLENSTFNGCTALASVSLPEGLKVVGKGAFRGCVSLRSIALPDSVVSIGLDAFRNSGLVSTRISERMQIGKGAFADCAWLKAAEIEEGTMRLPDEIFQGCRLLSDVELPKTLRIIGAHAFQKIGLHRAVFPTSLTEIGTEAFAETQIRNLEIPDTVRQIGPGAFRRTHIETVYIPSRTQVGAGAFEDCRELREAYVSGSVQMGPGDRPGPFNGCSSLTRLVLGDDAKEFPSGLCYGLSALEELQFPDTIRQIGEAAFYKCALRTFEIPPSVTEIGAEAFAASSLETIVLPDSITTLGPGIFKDCVHLRKVVLPAHMTRIPDNMFKGCTSLREVNLPETLTDIGDSAFFGCTSLEHIDLPDSVMHIGTSAFQRSGLRRVKIPETVQIVGKNAFRECRNLNEITLDAECTQVYKRAFAGTPASRNGAVPKPVTRARKKKKHR